ncbi:hypothetical protein QE441_003259 [Chryseobacterium sp. SORGH_AS909]|uniref:Uncharacterized protein n=1 Tax=Chryseobacterium camelliae TaxID=1265445 RepID=A0ABU0TIV1_9FLAO|nr:hypothetical protein [Chryseobacterium camelliae]MDQ1100122.1 hypothetical protein [Chryseobacterium sp. SORGH_AS_1048]MDR6087465.1 hypothetical protein [Chryseobacterium sp. SORGH_AS_0909]MDR6131839.1 hypothetical protein [Chryseobacterium sp. SORGH_AS_1175]MDT3406014.1 hypothetical protein [Pseudacidovorax intermedius]
MCSSYFQAIIFIILKCQKTIVTIVVKYSLTDWQITQIYSHYKNLRFLKLMCSSYFQAIIFIILKCQKTFVTVVFKSKFP